MSSLPSPSDRGHPPEDEFDFHVDNLDADDEKNRDFYHHVSVHQDSYVPLAEHHSANGEHSYYVLFDRSATYGHPGDPQFLAVHLRRDQEGATFDYEYAQLPLVPMAQSWLIHRGCPSESIAFAHEIGPQPADETTRALERRLVSDGESFAMGLSYTEDDPDDMVTLVVLRAMDERAPSPFRVLVEEVDADLRAYTLREGGFSTVEEARHWYTERLSGRAVPLPPVRPTAALPSQSTMPAKSPAVRPPGRQF
ncbi:hypothetical protein ACFUEM_25195 [Streptomyces anulatus]|uniref:hypothetical protein n=1 Tax=Streptomyces anulatus TaxID=1892 RepID=UPI0035DB90EC